MKRNGHSYLFASYDTCCTGTGSTYRIKVGRATGVTGPYRDRNGVSMLDNGGTPVMETHGRYIGPGGQSILADSDGDLLVYHYYDGQDNTYGCGPGRTTTAGSGGSSRQPDGMS